MLGSYKVILMDRELYEKETGEDWLTEKEIDERMEDRVGGSIDEVDKEWMNLVRVSYQMEDVDPVQWVEELGAATSIIIIVLDSEDVNEPHKEDEELLESMKQQDDGVGAVARVVDEDDSIMFDNAGDHPRKDGYTSIEVWT